MSKIAEIRELIESSRRGSCLDIPMREACARLCDALDYAKEQYHRVSTFGRERRFLAKINDILEGKDGKED